MRLLLVMIASAMLLSSCQNDVEYSNDLLQRIPTDSRIILHTERLADVHQFLQSNELFGQLEKLSRLQEIKKAADFLGAYDLDHEALVALSMEGRNEVVITLITNTAQFPADSTSLHHSLTYNGEKIEAHSKEGLTVYSLNHKGIHLASTSQLVIENLINRNIENYVFDESFRHIYQRTYNNDFSIYVKASSKNWLEQFLMGRNTNANQNHALWYQLEPQNSEAVLQLDGILTYRDSMRMDHDLYNNLRGQENRVQEIAPVNLINLRSVTYDGPEQLVKNLSRFHSKKINVSQPIEDLLENTSEMSEIQLQKELALVFTLKPYEAIFMNLDSLSTAKFTYREQTVYELAEALNTSSIVPLVKQDVYPYVTVLGQHMIFSKSQATPETFISNYQNKTVLSEQSWWKSANRSISRSSSLLKITSLDYFKSLAEVASTADKKIMTSLDREQYPLMISQYVHEDEYAHYHIVVPTTQGTSIEQQISQAGVFKSPKKIIAGPFLFPNHIAKTHDVAFQDEENVLHLISATGKKWWSKPLDAQILGTPEVTDAYKNGRKQMAFATSGAVYFLDRNGKDVNSYPKKLKQPITQPLSVFDYDNRREYRFLVTQEDELIMFDREGDVVKGFNYRPDGSIVSKPQHCRVGRKDFIAFAKADGNISLLHRTGGVRTKVKQKVNPRGPLYFHENRLKTLTTDGALATVDLVKGEVVLSGKWGAGEHLVTNEKLLIRQDNNVLNINGVKTTLPYGTYLPARLSHLKDGNFVHLVESGEHRVYIIDEEGDILPSLPVYGKSTSSLAQSKGRYLATLDGDDVIIYKW
ncbi:hypothetical protein [Nonlabens xiamenensis]|uniref:hypothetical protein n=1 Tax=Nonlabens xiamenensis TaxID=2341043 RepID=UPI000F60B381|nr:hypothetical protein [Nonlabens xiamenensis]